jgi:hypothetical protein
MDKNDEIDRAIEAILLFSSSQTHLERPTALNHPQTSPFCLGNNFGDGIGAEGKRANETARRFRHVP